MADRTVLDALREREKHVPPWMFACYRLGHFISARSRVCVCCLQVIPEEPDRG